MVAQLTQCEVQRNGFPMIYEGDEDIEMTSESLDRNNDVFFSFKDN